MSKEDVKFWKLSRPEYRSERQYEFINGYADHPYSLPGVWCSVCKQIWASTKILPYECPEEFRKHKNIIDGSPISEKELKCLTTEISAMITVQSEYFKELQPGNTFQPVYLDIQTTPKSDFLWSCFGSLLVSERIKDAFELNEVSGITFVPVHKRKIGSKPYKMYPFTPNQLDATYYEMIILGDSGRPPGVVEKSLCEGCGRRELDTKERKFVMLEEMWRGTDIFFLGTTIMIIITDRVKTLLEELGATNVIYEVCDEGA